MHHLVKISKENKKAQHISKYDELTKVYNRRGLQESLSKIKGTKLNNSNIILIDIDHFKKVNDTYGHNVGDSVLSTLCNILKNCVKSEDIVARYGGEEFVVVSVNSTFQNSLNLAEKIRKQVENYNFEIVKNLTISLGVANYLGNNTLIEWVKKADDALYKAKETSRNAVFYFENNEIKPYSKIEKIIVEDNKYGELYKFLLTVPFEISIWTLEDECIFISESKLKLLKTTEENYKKNYCEFRPKYQNDNILSSKLHDVYLENLLEKNNLTFDWKYLDSKGNLIVTTIEASKIKYLDKNIIIYYIKNHKLY